MSKDSGTFTPQDALSPKDAPVGRKTDDLQLSHARPNPDVVKPAPSQSLRSILLEREAPKAADESGRKGKSDFANLPAEKFERMNVAGRFTGILDRAKAGDIAKIAEWMPEWNAATPLSHEQKYRMSVVSHYVNGDVGDIALEHLRIDRDIQSLDRERARRTSPIRTDAPLRRETALLSMLDRYETEARIDAIIEAEQAAEHTIIDFHPPVGEVIVVEPFDEAA